MTKQYYITFDADVEVGIAESEQHVKRLIANHLATWSGHGTTARIAYDKPYIDNNKPNCVRRVEIESWSRSVLTLHYYYIYEVQND